MNTQDLLKTVNGILDQEFDAKLLLKSSITGIDYTDATIEFFSDKVTKEWVKNHCTIGRAIDLDDEGYDKFEGWYADYKKTLRKLN